MDKKFYEMGRQERLDYLKQVTGVGDIESMLEPIPFESANRMVENAIGSMTIPMGIATNFVINGKERLIPAQVLGELPCVVELEVAAAGDDDQVYPVALIDLAQ